MIRALVAAALLWPAFAAAQTLSIPAIPEVSVTVEPAEALTEGWYAQGQIVVTVRVASRRPFEALDLAMPDFDGFDVVELLRPRTREIRSYAGDGFALETALALFPRQPGDLAIPPIRAAGMVRDEAGEEIRFDDATDALRLAVAGPPADYPADWWLASPKVAISETWSKPLAEVRVGDVIRREVTIVAEGVTAERVRAPELPPSKSVPVVGAGFSARTIVSASGVSAEIVRAWDLTIQSGVYADLAPVGVTYWNPIARRVARATLPGFRIEPLPADPEAVALRLMSEAAERRHGARLAAISALAVLAAPVLILGLMWIWAASPRPADWRLRRDLAAARAPEDAWRAVRRWERGARAASVGATLPGEASARVFGSCESAAESPSIASALIRGAQRERMERLRLSLSRLKDWLIGPAVRLKAIDRPAGRRK